MEELLNSADAKETNLNRSQALIQIINPNVLYMVAPRASGKTSGGIGPRIQRLSELMPRAQIGLVMDTYERIDKSLMANLEAYWNEELGLYPEIDYVIHKKPPDHWVKPLFPPKKWDRVTSFATGTILVEGSLAVPGSLNGFNLQALIGDEVKYWDEKKFKAEIKPAIRGGRKHYGHLPEFQSQWFFSDKLPGPGADIGWVLKKKKEIDWEKVDIVYTLQMEVFRLQREMEQFTSTETIYKYKHRIEHIEEVLRQLRIDLVYYCDALPYENKEILGDKFFRDMKRDLTAFEYEVAIENKDPDRAQKPYYANLGKPHYYRGMADYNPNKPLIIALDYQFSITPVVTAQWDRLADSAYTTLNFIRSLHTLHPDSITGALKLWADEYEGHPDKIVYYVFDQTAIGRSPYGTTFKDTVVDYLTGRGWAVVEIYTGDTPDHDVKYEAIKKVLAHQGDRTVRMNEEENPFLIKAMEKTNTVLVSGKTKKDKSSERSDKVPPEESTHYPDAWDQVVWGAIVLDLVPMNDDPGIDISARY